MDFSGARPHATHGDGRLDPSKFARLGGGVVFEDGVLVCAGG